MLVFGLGQMLAAAVAVSVDVTTDGTRPVGGG
jgi:hypothetical protein